MANRSVARRYAWALIEVAEEAGVVEETFEELAFVADALSGVPEFEAVVSASVVDPAKLKGMIDEAFVSAGLSSVARGLLAVMCENNRLPLVPEVRDAYARLLDERASRVRATVVGGQPLAEEQLSRLTDALKQRTGREVILAVEQDPSLIAGARVRMDNTVLDGSARGRLEAIRKGFE